MSSRNVLDIKKAAAKKSEPQRSSTTREAKTVRLRVRRRRARILTACACFVATAGVVGGLGAASHLDRLAIHDVSVSGAQVLAPEALTASVSEALSHEGFELFSRKNMFLLPKHEIEQQLSASFPRIKDVTLSRPSLLAQAVTVLVEERTPYATWCDAETRCYVMDAGGFIFAEASGTPASAYVFHGGLLPQREVIGQTFLRGRIYDSVALLDALAAAGFAPAGLTVDTEKDFSVSLADGPSLHVPFDMRVEDVVRNLETALEAEALRDRLADLEYIDLRFGNKVYYK